MTELMAEAIKTTPQGASMLDIGFGIGGAAFDFAQSLNATVHGIDLGEQGYEMAQQELARRNDERLACGQDPLKVTFALQDCREATFEAASFDVIYSRDTFVHLSAEEKAAVFAKCCTWLKPNGKLCIADYSLGRNSMETGEPTPDFATYLQARDYHMYTAKQYSEAFETAGFGGIEAQDMAHWYCVSILLKEMLRPIYFCLSTQFFLKSGGLSTIL